MKDIDLVKLKELALVATPGRVGDRIDGSGSIKYQCFGNDGSLVLQADHKNDEYGFIGPNNEADEAFFRACDPLIITALIEQLEAAQRVMEAVVKASSLRGIRPFDGIDCDPPTLMENAEACGDAMSARIRELEANPPMPHHNSLMQLSNKLAAAEAELKRRDEQEPVAWQFLDDDGSWQHEVDPEDAKNLGFTVSPLYATAPAALLPQEKTRISQGGVALALSDYDTGWNECRQAAKALGCQPEKVVSLPDYSNTYKDPFASEIFHHVTRQLDAAGVKWVEGE